MEKASADLELNVDGEGHVTSVKLRGSFMAPLRTTPANSPSGTILNSSSSSSSSSRHRVLCIGLNPAIQKVLKMRDVRLGEVNRVSGVTVGIGGKGQNCA